MRGRCFVIIVLRIVLTSSSVPFDNRYLVHNDTKIELEPLLISTKVNETITISAPYLRTKYSHHYLYTPTGDVIDLDSVESIQSNNKNDFDDIRINVTSLRRDSSELITLGPLIESDHGNWVLSVFYPDIDGNWVELFQIITVEIIETNSEVHYQVPIGSAFRPKLPRPIIDLQSCELSSPETTFDRYYDRMGNDPNCEFIVENTTKTDQGRWTVIGIGRIVHKIVYNLEILDVR
ncbi:uncharacterized protein LOC114239370 [Bombyx mandarina]|uniref:Uncharacterized protein LOC114239370 n=1 Tax=Bombyx mandarina TaxID=7092 RepID=A0A6J2J7W1_BOMMA|nr:uncharacterized protein LOC114239370 [Bombyx mandarina]